jgi:hypothetical protein
VPEVPEFDALLRAAAAAAESGRIDESVATYQRALALSPSNSALHHNIGVLLARRGDLAGAIEHLVEAERLNPRSPVSSLALGHVCFGAGRIADAAAAFERALQRAPDSQEAADNLGYAACTRRIGACAARSRAGALAPPVRRRDLSRTVRSAECDGQAGRSGRAFRIPGRRVTVGVAGRDRPALGAPGHARGIKKFSDGRDWITSKTCLAFGGGIHPVLRLQPRRARLYQLQRVDAAAPGTRRQSSNARSASGRLRVGYLSGDFRRHVMGDLMLDVFACHDRERFEVFAYSLLPETLEDATTARFRNISDGFASLAALDDRAAAQRIADDCVDVLVDLTSHTQARPGLLVRKPAR